MILFSSLDSLHRTWFRNFPLRLSDGLLLIHVVLDLAEVLEVNLSSTVLANAGRRLAAAGRGRRQAVEVVLDHATLASERLKKQNRN